MLKYYLPDAIATDLVSDRAVSTQGSIPVRLYLNGEYWYDTYTLERYDNEYFRQHYQVNDRELIKNGVPDEDTVAYSEGPPYNEFTYWVEHTDFSDMLQWEQFQKEVDVQSYIDYIITNYYFCNIDFHDLHNYVLWHSPLAGTTEYEDLKWRWCIYDIDALSWVNNNSKYGDPAALNVFSNNVAFDLYDTALFPPCVKTPYSANNSFYLLWICTTTIFRRQM